MPRSPTSARRSSSFGCSPRYLLSAGSTVGISGERRGLGAVPPLVTVSADKPLTVD